MIRRYFKRGSEVQPLERGNGKPPVSTEEPSPSLGRPIERVPVSLSIYEKLDLRHRRFDDMNANKNHYGMTHEQFTVFELWRGGR